MHVTLHNKQAFKDVLKSYTPSDEAKQLLADMRLVILQGISGSGRNTIIDHLVKTGSFHQIISDTTRPPKLRNGEMERHGVQYFFRKEEELLDDLHRGMFLEAELVHDQQVSGISIRELSRAVESGQIPINEVAREGVMNIRQAKPDTLFFFVVPPSYEIWLDRLTKREVMSDEELTNRKQSAIHEIEEAFAAPDFHFLVNDELERAASVIRSVTNGGHDENETQQGKLVARGILTKLKS
jgi:guanylate kinase